MTGVANASEILSKGYFPRELPPAFSTTAFGRIAEDLTVRPREPSAPARVNLARPGGLRRGLAIPNPEAQIRVVSCIAKNWAEINEVYDRSEVSLSRPAPGTLRAIEQTVPFFDLPAERARRAYRARYTVKMDVSQHYGSIYTHSIPWAVLGKETEKRRSDNNDPGTFSNKLDAAVRNGQDKQTVGIPIGPDTSLVISELILSSVDSDVAGEHSIDPAKVLRYMDDFEYYALSRSEADEILATWEAALARYELQINPLKTEVLDGPPAIQARWRTELSQFRIRDGNSRAAANDVREFMGLAFDLRRSYPREPVLSYAIKRAASTLHPFTEAWRTYLDMSLAAATTEPSSLPHLATVLYQAEQIDVALDRETLSMALSNLVHRHAPLQHGVEVSWALWLLRRYQSPLEGNAARRVALMTDNAALLLIRELADAGLVEGVPDLSSVDARAHGSNLQDSDWLLAYEYSAHGWGPPDAVDAHPFFEQIADAGVRFFDPTMAVKQVPPVGRTPVY